MEEYTSYLESLEPEGVVKEFVSVKRISLTDICSPHWREIWTKIKLVEWKVEEILSPWEKEYLISQIIREYKIR